MTVPDRMFSVSGVASMIVRSPGLKRPKTIPPEVAARTPPGQHVTSRWPVLHDGDVPAFDPATWRLCIHGLVDEPVQLSWDEFQALPRRTMHGDMHCVTRWTKLDNIWDGVAPADILDIAGVQSEARFVFIRCDGGYTANLPLATLLEDDVLFATGHAGQPLTPEHGFPVRLVVPNRYAWKSAKWVRSIEIRANDRPGFWERYGYNNRADPWREERFAEEQR